jgi:hypothetical protein
MKAIRINTIIDPSVIRFDELKDFNGKKAEIIILVDDVATTQDNDLHKASGALMQYADVTKVAEEKAAYEKHICKKHGDC